MNTRAREIIHENSSCPVLVGVLLLSVRIGFAQEAPAAAPAQRAIPGPDDVLGPPPVMAVDWSQKPKAWSEYQFALRNRVKWLRELPSGSATVLDIPYVGNPQQCASFPNSNQTLDLYVPPGDGPFPVVVYIHGGAWHGGCKEGEGTDLARYWLPEKLAVASIDYRLPPPASQCAAGSNRSDRTPRLSDVERRFVAIAH